MGCFSMVAPDQIGALEFLGKFQRILPPGLHCIVPSSVSGKASTRMKSIHVKIETKTKDDVFVRVQVTVAFIEKAGAAVCTLGDPTSRIDAHVSDVIMGHVPLKPLEELFDSTEEIAEEVREKLVQGMQEYGFLVRQLLVIDMNPKELPKQAEDIDPSESVEQAMNRIRGSSKQRMALQDQRVRAALERVEANRVAQERAEEENAARAADPVDRSCQLHTGLEERAEADRAVKVRTASEEKAEADRHPEAQEREQQEIIEKVESQRKSMAEAQAAVGRATAEVAALVAKLASQRQAPAGRGSVATRVVPPAAASGPRPPEFASENSEATAVGSPLPAVEFANDASAELQRLQQKANELEQSKACLESEVATLQERNQRLQSEIDDLQGSKTVRPNTSNILWGEEDTDNRLPVFRAPVRGAAREVGADGRRASDPPAPGQSRCTSGAEGRRASDTSTGPQISSGTPLVPEVGSTWSSPPLAWCMPTVSSTVARCLSSESCKPGSCNV